MASIQTFGRVLSVEPLITISKRALWLGQPLGFAGLIENLAAAGPSLHLVGTCFTIEPHDLPADPGDPFSDTADALARDHEAMRRRHPSARFVILANTAVESSELSRRGVPNILVNELIFVDEREFDIVEPRPGPTFEAVYNAVLLPFKRHGLARELASLLLICKQPQGGALAQAQAMLPRGAFANLDDKGVWRQLSRPAIATLYANCGVGLCLSAAEGAMRGSMEYLLCGLPVVSTPSIGGRDRYFRDDYTIVCEPTPAAVREAVAQALSLNHSRAEVRARVRSLVEADRAEFLRVLNRLVESEFGAPEAFKRFDPFYNLPIRPSQTDARWFQLPPSLAGRPNS